MFTGLIEETGKIEKLTRGRNSAVVTIAAKLVLDGIKIGDSIAVDGACLTVSGFTPRTFTADIMHETLNRTSFRYARSGSAVNLERAMPSDGRFGGHIVTGHVDGTGSIAKIVCDGIAVVYTLRAPPPLIRYIVEKGSVALDGISLTVASVDRSKSEFSVSVIPHTLNNTALRSKRSGAAVNIECDVTAKYIESLTTCNASRGVDKKFLYDCGFTEEQ